MVERAEPLHDRLARIVGQFDVDQRARHRHILGVAHARHAIAQQLQMVDLIDDIVAHRPVGVDRHADPARVHAIHHIIEDRHLLLKLRVRAHDMIALHEGFHRGLPVGGQHRGELPFGAHLVSIVGVQTRRQRPQLLPESRRIIIEIDEHTAHLDLAAARAQRQIGFVQLPLAEQMAAIDEGVFPLDIPAPAVEGADEPLALAIAMAPLGQRHAAMAAGIVEGANAILGPHDDDRLAKIAIFDPVADFGHLLHAARHLPDMRP